MTWVAIVSGVIGLIGLILRQWFKEKSKVDQAQDTAKEIGRKVQKMRTHLTTGRADLVQEEMDFLDRDIRILLQLRKANKRKR